MLALLCMLMATTFTQHIVDYTHSQALEDTHFDLTQNYDINISPPPIPDDYFTFPGSCALHRQLYSNQLIEEDALKLINE